MRNIQNWEQFNEAKKTSKKKKDEEEKDDECSCKCKGEEKEGKKGLTAKQKKLPPALQAAILKRMKK